MNNLPPILVIDSIEVGHKEVSAELCMGPRRERIVLGFSIPDLATHKRMPNLLDRCFQPKRAVIDTLVRAYRGEIVHVPLDLSHTVRGAEPPWEQWPMYLGPEAAASAPTSIAEVTQVERNTPEPGLVTVHLRVLGVPTVVTVDPRETERARTLFHFVEGAHPWQLTDAEAWAMMEAISGTLERGIKAPPPP